MFQSMLLLVRAMIRQSNSNLIEVEDDNIISKTEAPTENIVTLSNNNILDYNTLKPRYIVMNKNLFEMENL